MICFPYYLKFLTLFVVFIGGWLGYEMAGFVFGDNLFSMHSYCTSSFAGSIWFIPYFSTYGVSFGPLGVGYKATKVFDSGWIEYFGGQGLYWILFNIGRVNQWFQYNNLKVFLNYYTGFINYCTLLGKNLNSSECLLYGVESRKENNRLERCARNIRGANMLFQGTDEEQENIS